MDESTNPNPGVEAEKRMDESANSSPEAEASSSLNAGAQPYILRECVLPTFYLQPVYIPIQIWYSPVIPPEASTSTPAHVTRRFGVCFSYIFNF